MEFPWCFYILDKLWNIFTVQHPIVDVYSGSLDRSVDLLRVKNHSERFINRVMMRQLVSTMRGT